MIGREVHYHLFMGAANSAPMASTTFEDYDESIRNFLKLSKSVYGNWEYWSEGLSYKNLLIASDFGAGNQMTIGTAALCVQWARCRLPCMSPSWN